MFSNVDWSSQYYFFKGRSLLRAKLNRMLGTVVASLGLLAAALLPATVPMRLVNNRVFVDVSRNGAGPFRCIVDSGAGKVNGHGIGGATHRALGLLSKLSSADFATAVTLRLRNCW